jgi:hypothetical protein
MTTIVWDALDERTYETGIDRGVIELPSLPLVPWNGLISVDESEIDNVGMRTYFEGSVYTNFHFGGFFAADVESFGFPEELSQILGVTELFPGLSITAQPRAEFNFSYRTMVNESDYKIHLVYNCIVANSDRDNETITDDIEAQKYTFKIITLPPKPVFFRPTSHIVINSVTADSDMLEQVEDILYGTVSTDPAFPTQIEVVEIFEG